jgi:hypothetical protein
LTVSFSHGDPIPVPSFLCVSDLPRGISGREARK